MRVLVTGGAGYIGSVLSKILVEKGHDVSCLDRFFFGKEAIENVSDKINLIKDDIRWFNSDILKGVDAVLDLASLSNDPSGELDPQKTLEINYKGRVRVATLSKKYKVGKYVLASTCSVYGFQEGTLNEDSKLNPLTTYAKANMMAEKEVLPLADNSFTVTVLRQATVYGFSHRMRFDLAINGMALGFFQNGSGIHRLTLQFRMVRLPRYEKLQSELRQDKGANRLQNKLYAQRRSKRGFRRPQRGKTEPRRPTNDNRQMVQASSGSTQIGQRPRDQWSPTMKIAVIGSTGQLGTDVMKTMRDEHEGIGFTHENLEASDYT